jgi:NAD(P)-dependent dehydrogenase (short-subunit alcohol dehydrogenase family)
VIASRKLAACETLAKEVREETGRKALACECHVGRWEDCDALFEQVYDRFGRADVLVNNAGMSPLYPSLAEHSEELYDKVLSVNLKGPFRLSSLFGTRMAEKGGGSIINISSTAALEPGQNELPYAAAKSALNTLTAGMARAFAPKVRVNCIMPGAFLTDISKAWPQAMLDSFEHYVPLQRAGAPEEIVGAALFLASDASSYMTGAVLKLDGGAAWAPA